MVTEIEVNVTIDKDGVDKTAIVVYLHGVEQISEVKQEAINGVLTMHIRRKQLDETISVEQHVNQNNDLHLIVKDLIH